MAASRDLVVCTATAAAATLALFAATPAVAATNSCKPPSESVTVGEIVEDPDALLDDCVTVRGITVGDPYHRSFYADVAAIYLAAQGHRDRQRVGLLDLDDEAVGSPVWLNVTGRVDTCKRIWDRAQAAAGPDEIAFIGGYCHYTFGPSLWVTSYRVDKKGRLERIVGERYRRSLGNIEFVPASRSDTRQIMEAVGALLEAARRSDRAALARLFKLDGRSPDEVAEELGPLLSPATAFATLPTNAQIMLFAGRDARRPEERSETIA
ncbi:MAG TPA: hypothetical protein VJ597_03545, partial [Sphingomicrobium sp.]|nr:hypothetical protein [Sphingomicrobium sp.]